MGCSIHAMLEYKLGGKWRCAGYVHSNRNYPFFSILSGVRVSEQMNYEKINVADAPVELPDDVTAHVRQEYEAWEGDAHSLSVIRKPEMEEAIREVRRICERDSDEDMQITPGYEEDWMQVLQRCAMFAEDARIIAWYDN